MNWRERIDRENRQNSDPNIYRGTDPQVWRDFRHPEVNVYRHNANLFYGLLEIDPLVREVQRVWGGGYIEHLQDRADFENSSRGIQKSVTIGRRIIVSGYPTSTWVPPVTKEVGHKPTSDYGFSSISGGSSYYSPRSRKEREYDDRMLKKYGPRRAEVVREGYYTYGSADYARDVQLSFGSNSDGKYVAVGGRLLKREISFFISYGPRGYDLDIDIPAIQEQVAESAYEAASTKKDLY